jgi:hypothetical protein
VTGIWISLGVVFSGLGLIAAVGGKQARVLAAVAGMALFLLLGLSALYVSLISD